VPGRRRVVVGTDAHGQSVVVDDSAVTASRLAPRGNRLTMLWGSDESVRSATHSVEPDEIPFLPPLGGWRVFTLTIEPDTSPPVSMDAGQMPADLAAAMAAGGGRGMHTTETTDVVIVLDGDISVELDDGLEVPLHTGDALVQLASRHGWRNHSAHPATIAVMMAGTTRTQQPGPP
jgi:hypothetical protein